MFTDGLWILYVLVAVSWDTIKFSSNHDQTGNCGPDVDKSIFYWFGVSDTVIGVYFLVLFIGPLRQIAKMEPEISIYIKKIIWFSSIMMITTIIVTVIVAAYPHHACMLYIYIYIICTNMVLIICM